jgi:hypothetical protein
VFRSIQESIKDDVRSTSFRMESQLSRVTDYPLQMRLISNVIQNCAKDLGYQDDVLTTMGVTSSNVVYSTISNFDMVISKML